MATNLQTLFATSKDFGLTEEMVVFQVLKSYLKDCYGVEITVEQATNLSSVPTVANYSGQAGIYFDNKFYPVNSSFKDLISLEKNETREKSIYHSFDYSTPVDIAGAESSYRIPSLIRDLDNRSLKPLFNKSNDATSAALMLYPGAPNADTKDGDYVVTEVITVGDNYRLLTDCFSVLVNAKNAELIGVVNLPSSLVTVKDGKASVGEVSLTGGGQDILTIPAEKGFTIEVVGLLRFPGKEALALVTSEGKNYWATKEAKKLLQAIAPIEPTTSRKFLVTVVDITSKDDKQYAETKTTVVK